jgi:hypothetical protein
MNSDTPVDQWRIDVLTEILRLLDGHTIAPQGAKLEISCLLTGTADDERTAPHYDPSEGHVADFYTNSPIGEGYTTYVWRISLVGT